MGDSYVYHCSSSQSVFFHVLIMITGLFFTDRFNLGYFKFLYPFLLQVIAGITYMK